MRYFHAAAVAHHSAISYAFILAAVAFPITDGAENLFAEQAIAFRFERAIIDCFRFCHFSIRPVSDDVRRSEPDRNFAHFF
jgi:hypothetical protein